METFNHFLHSSTHTVIISTKEGRFIHQLLGQQGINVPRERIYGKEVKRPKYETLRLVIQQIQDQQVQTSDARPPVVVFVEDRLKALQGVAAQPDLDHVHLFLADWGYNTEGDRTIARNDHRIQLLSLSNFQELDHR